MNRIRWYVSLFSSSLSGIFHQFTYEEKIDWKRPYIICPNHTSNLDIATIILLAKRNLVFLGKDELLENFVTKIYFETIDISLNRDSKMSAFRAFKKVEESLKKGISVVIFPEGLIAEDYPPVLYPFKNGLFRLAIEQKIAIIPVTICNNWEIMWDDGKKYGTRPGICDIRVHKPVETEHLTLEDEDNLKEKVYNTIDQELKKYQTQLNSIS